MRSIESTMRVVIEYFLTSLKSIVHNWKQKIVFSCTSDPKDGCKHLKIQNCELKNSTCQNQ
ncbi:putative conjugative transfer protein TraN [Orientia tsutsugamushi str. Gilliam]|uniref:Putative conjugative transfer protein TraN n=1 Tax=Orientia tsutsugamushi str. Gilliam TaxID=1359184 RepID=A0A0F3M753_ORITS|nr:putative conjugative transfer protein TraN [Orientia tsutsugamushi str. Gilliam]